LHITNNVITSAAVLIQQTFKDWLNLVIFTKHGVMHKNTAGVAARACDGLLRLRQPGAVYRSELQFI
jgi:hypothetical protein